MSVSAQEVLQDSVGADFSEEYLYWSSDTCRQPAVVAQAVIHYNTYSRAYLEFVCEDSLTVFYYAPLGAVVSTPVTAVNGEILLENLQHNSLYEVTTVNNCGEEVPVAVFSTYDQNVEQRGMEVSTRMYDAVVDFQLGNGLIPLMEYLENLETVSPYEKVAFVQQFLYKGEKLTTDLGPVIPPPPPVISDCLCIFVYNYGSFVNPGVMNPDGTISAKIENSGGKIPLSGNANWWWGSATRGAAKWNQVWSEGWKAGSTENTLSTEVVNNSNASPYYGQTRFNLFCTNFFLVPENCRCDVLPVSLYYHYSSEVEAYAHRKAGGLGEKKARAMAQDLAIVTLSRQKPGGTEVEVLGAGDIRAVAECEWAINGEFFQTLTGVLAPLAQLISESPDIGQIISDMLEQLGELFVTPLIETADCDQNSKVASTFFQDVKTIDLTPNEPISLTVASFSNIMVGGKRSWFSWGKITSGFYTAGIIQGGVPVNPKDTHCCTNKYGTWVLASLGKPNTTEDLKNVLGVQFGDWIPWNLPVIPGTNIVVLSEFGKDEVINQACDRDIAEMSEEEVDPRLTQDLNRQQELQPSQLVVFDVAGRVVLQGQTSGYSAQEAILFFQQRADNMPAGLYFLHLKNGLNSETIKVFHTK